ncbi:MAG TPA: ABC transporter ATP-binding protein [Bacillales bacterium]
MITMTHVEKQLGDFRLAVDDLVLYDGVTIVIGKNGAGKSTFLQLAATAQFPDQGEISYNRKTVKEDLPIIRMDIGFLPSGIELYEEMTPKKFLLYMCTLKGIREGREEISALLDSFGLLAFQNKKIAKLSEGQKQRVAIAQTFLGLPRFVLLDEPLTCLDIAERKKVMAYISNYANNRTVLTTTHELNDWEGICEGILWIENGEVHFHGSPEQWTSSLPLSVWKGIVPVDYLLSVQDGKLIHSRISRDRAHVRIIANQNPDPAVFTETKPTIEDAYFIRKADQFSSSK